MTTNPHLDVGLVGLRRRAAELDTIRGELRGARSTLRAANLGLDAATAGTTPGIAPADVEVRELIGQALDLLRTAGERIAANITETNRSIYVVARAIEEGAPSDRARTLARFADAEAAGDAELGLLPR